MKVLITGANGMVARGAAKHCRSIGDEVAAVEGEPLQLHRPLAKPILMRLLMQSYFSMANQVLTGNIKMARMQNGMLLTMHLR